MLLGFSLKIDIVLEVRANVEFAKGATEWIYNGVVKFVFPLLPQLLIEVILMKDYNFWFYFLEDWVRISLSEDVLYRTVRVWCSSLGH